MVSKRLMMIGLDGFEPTIAERMIAEGELPTFARILADGAVAALDHGAGRGSGLAWEHVATGLSPDDAERWSLVEFNPSAYRPKQRGSRFSPFPAALDCRTVVFDAPYFDLRKAPNVRGMTNWGSHDPGVAAASNPPDLWSEVVGRFGRYPAREFIYGFVWPSEPRARRMAEAMVKAVEVRSAICEWLFAEALPDWDLAILVASDFHSAAEALWYGIDEAHPLHGLPSAAAAREGLEGVYRAADRMIARLLARFPDADFVIFNLHGMGPNLADVPTMALLPELLHRAERGSANLRAGKWRDCINGAPIVDEDANWSGEILRLMPVRRRLNALVSRLAHRAGFGDQSVGADPLNWMPAKHYAPDWRYMRYFALPAYHAGQVRINLRGREAAGVVAPGDFEAACEEVEELVAACTNPIDGGPVVRNFVRTPGDPLRRPSSQADITIEWHKNVLGFAHPRLGTIGPLPWRRTGGHTGGDGFAWLLGPNIRPGRIGRRSAFDVVSTVIDLLDRGRPPKLSGSSFASLATNAASADGSDSRSAFHFPDLEHAVQQPGDRHLHPLP